MQFTRRISKNTTSYDNEIGGYKSQTILLEKYFGDEIIINHNWWSLEAFDPEKDNKKNDIIIIGD